MKISIFKTWNFHGYRFMFYCRRVQKTLGVNSILKNGYGHMIMLDCEGCDITEIISDIKRMQQKHALPVAHLCDTGRYDHWHVIFFTNCHWRNAIRIAADCNYEDLNHLKFSLQRGWFTLRLSIKNGADIKYHSIIESPFPDESKITDLKSIVKYETAWKDNNG